MNEQRPRNCWKDRLSRGRRTDVLANSDFTCSNEDPGRGFKHKLHGLEGKRVRATSVVMKNQSGK